MKIKLFLIVFCTYLVNEKIVAQDTYTMLNHIGNILSNHQEDLYVEVENYLNTLDEDSIEANLETETLFHLNKAHLYILKYNDYEKSNKELDFLYNKIKPIKHLQEYNDSYKTLLLTYGQSLLGSGQVEKAILLFNKVLVENFDDELDSRLYSVYYTLAGVYADNNEIALSEDCHSKCQEFLIKSYIRKYPEYSFYYDNYKTLKVFASQLEKKNLNNTEEYINNLCSLGSLLHKVDQGEFWESMSVMQKALKCAIENRLLKVRGLEECYIGLQDIYIKYFPEPYKTQGIEGLIPLMIDYFSGTLMPEDIYESIAAASYGANEQYEKCVEYYQKVLNLVEENSKTNKEKLLQIYQRLIQGYLGCGSDSTNQIAYQYLQKFGNLISKENTEYYDWFLDNKGLILRYLYKNEKAINCFKGNLSYFDKKYGKISDKYVSTLNQLALCYPYDSEMFMSYLLQAKSLIANSNDIDKSTIRGVSVNLARNYIITKKYEQAKAELNMAAAIEKEIFGKIRPLTEELINQCKEK